MDEYKDEVPPSNDASIPRWLFWSYFILIGWGVVWALLYWNGIWGWLDRGYWFELEKAANTLW